MTPRQWQELQELFEEVIQKPLEERPGVLRQLESQIQDSAIRMELRRLVEHAEAGSEFLRPVGGLGIFPELNVLRPGDVIADRFEIRQSIGAGGMAEVFEAFDRKLGERVAIKVIARQYARDAVLLQRFYQEVQIARRITHPNICRIHDLGEHQGLPYLSMEFLEGETLSKRLERGPLALDTWHDCAQQLLQGLQAAHAAGIVHRDLKPSNLMLTGARLVILDFGLARPVLTQEDDGLTRSGTLVGTLDWMAPEQLLGEYDERSDLYSAALILLRALKQGTKAPGSSGLVGALRRATSDAEFQEQLPKTLSASWQYALLSCLQRDPVRRPRRVEDVQRLVEKHHVLPVRMTQFVGSHGKMLATVLVVLALLGVSLRSLEYTREERALRLSPGAAIMVAFTDNATREPHFDGVTSALRADFRQSSRFNLWDDQRMGEVLRAMRLDANTKPDVGQWREMAVREKVPLLVFSTVNKLGDTYMFSIRAEQMGDNPASPVAEWAVTETALGPAELFAALHKAADSVRAEAGENAAEISANNRLPQDITSSDWEALQLFGEARSLSAEKRPDEAISLLRRAIQRDPNFAMARMWLGDILDAQNKVAEGRQFWRQAIELAKAQHLSEHEHLNIESRYALEIWDLNNAEPILRDWRLKFPNDPLSSELLAWCLLQMGNFEEGIRIARESQKRFGPTEFGTSVLIRGLASKKDLTDIDQQIETLEKVSGRTVSLHFRAAVAAMRGDYDGAARFFQELIASNDVRESSRGTAALANLEADRGDLDAARRLLEDGIAKDREAGEEGFAAQKTVGLAFLEANTGNPKRALARARSAVSFGHSPLVTVQAVSILARYGVPDDAVSIMNTFPPDEGPKYQADLLRMRGEIAASRGNFRQAVELLDRANRTDRPNEPKEYLARALDLVGDHEGARLLYQRLVDASSIIWLADDQLPATRFLARQRLKSLEGRVK